MVRLASICERPMSAARALSWARVQSPGRAPALTSPAKLKLFDWLNRRPQCGRECRLCETKCTVGAIDPLGRINPNECVLCLRCQMIYHDPKTCPMLKNRAGRGARMGVKP